MQTENYPTALKSYDFMKEMNIKGVTVADKKFVQQHIAKYIRNSDTTVINPITGWQKESTPLISALVKFTQDLIYHDFFPLWLKKYGLTEGNKIAKFDRARYLILKLDNDIYMNVID